MTAVLCPHCQTQFAVTGDRTPPWCQRCGGDLRAKPVGAAAPAEELVPLTAAAPARAATRGGRWSNQRVATATPPPADTPAPAGGRRRARPAGPPDAEVTHENFDYEAAVRAAGFESTAPSLVCYGFAGLCLLLPVVSCGGRIAVFLGLSGAGACVTVAHSHGMPMPRRVLACVGIVALTWGTFIALVVCVLGAAGAFRGR